MLLSKTLKHKNIVFIKDQICEIQNFLPQDILEYLNNRIINAPEEEWSGGKKVLLNNDTKTYTSQWNKTMLKIDSNEISERLCQLVNEVFNGSHIFKNFEFIRRLKDNGSLVEHYDAQVDMTVEAGLIIYINDDYEGGEIFYSEKDFMHKPKANSLVIHPGNKFYKHGVHPVKNGTRYFLTNFADGRTKKNNV